MNPTYEKFQAYLEDLNGSYVKMSALLRSKISAVEADDIAKLEEIMGEEQVFLMITKGFDKNIAGFRSGLGFQGETLSEIIGELPSELRPAFEILHSSLKASLDEVKSLNDSCKSLLEANLHIINKKLRDLDKAGRPASYSTDKGPGPHILSKSI